MAASKGLVYSARKVSKILGLFCSTNVRCPRPINGQLIIYYPGCSLDELRDSPAGKTHMWQDNWDDGKGSFTAPPGYYEIMMRLTGSSFNNWSEQLKVCPGEMVVAPTAVAATALLLHLKETDNDLLEDGWCRCAEKTSPGFRAKLTVYKGRVSITDCWKNDCYDDLWLAVARKL